MQLELGQGLLPETAHEAQRTAACQAPRCWYKQKPGGHGQSQGQGVGAKSAKESVLILNITLFFIVILVVKD